MVVIQPRQSGTVSGPDAAPSFNGQIWLPIIGLLAVVLLVTIGFLLRTRMRGGASTMVVGAGATTLTAAQLAGAPAQPARRRRNRRRASQISTKSLPAYMEEPGDEEIVLVGRQLDTLNEGGQRTSTDSDDSLPHDGRPLLERDPTTMEHSAAGAPDRGSSPQPAVPEMVYVRGEAPSYFEVVNQDAADAAAVRPTVDLTDEPPSQPGTTPSNISHTRGSSFFRFLSRNDNDQPPSTSPESGQLGTWRPGHASSASLLSVRQSLSLSRTRSSDTQQGTIPLRNISAPIAHTLVRTSLTHPKSGPTEQQIKFLSSRESLGRFGMPYGDEARADPPSWQTVVAASASSSSLFAPGHGRGLSAGSSIAGDTPGPSTSTLNVASNSTPNLAQPDTTPLPESHSPEISIQPTPNPTAATVPVLPEIDTDTTYVPHRLSTIMSAVETPEASPIAASSQRRVSAQGVADTGAASRRTSTQGVGQETASRRTSLQSTTKRTSPGGHDGH